MTEGETRPRGMRSPRSRTVVTPRAGPGSRRPACDPTNQVGLIVEIPDMETFQQLMQSDEAAEAMTFDGVRPDTLVVFEEASGHL
jgi:hypothetical protein